MRVKQPEIFDPKREYKPGERAIYKGMVIIAELWTKAAQRLADDPRNPTVRPLQYRPGRLHRGRLAHPKNKERIKN